MREIFIKPLTWKKIHKMYTFSEGSNGYTPSRWKKLKYILYELRDFFEEIRLLGVHIEKQLKKKRAEGLH